MIPFEIWINNRFINAAKCDVKLMAKYYLFASVHLILFEQLNLARQKNVHALCSVQFRALAEWVLWCRFLRLTFFFFCRRWDSLCFRFLSTVLHFLPLIFFFQECQLVFVFFYLQSLVKRHVQLLDCSSEVLLHLVPLCLEGGSEEAVLDREEFRVYADGLYLG